MLIFDQNLSPAIPRHLRTEFPACVHVRDQGLAEAADSQILDAADDLGLIVVSEDEDLSRLAASRRSASKVVWIKLGNCTTRQVVELLRSHRERINAFAADLSASVLELP